MCNKTGNMGNHQMGRAKAKDLSSLSFQELEAIMNMSLRIGNGRYTRSYTAYYDSVAEEIRLELDKRLMNKLFDVI